MTVDEALRLRWPLLLTVTEEVPLKVGLRDLVKEAEGVADMEREVVPEKLEEGEAVLLLSCEEAAEPVLDTEAQLLAEAEAGLEGSTETVPQEEGEGDMVLVRKLLTEGELLALREAAPV